LKKCQCSFAEEVNQNELQVKMDKANKIERIYSSSSILNYKNYMFSNFKVISTKHEMLLKLAKQYVEEFQMLHKQGKGITIVGEKGNGKTHIAAAIANYLIQQEERNVAFENVPYLMSKIRSLYTQGLNTSSGERETEIEIINRLCSSDLLVLDDIGACAWSGKDEERLYILIDQCTARKTPIIATTNLKNDEEMINYLGDRAFSRLSAANVAIINTCTSYRDEQIKDNMTFSGDWTKFYSKE
ncbi:ATP-binding protein, partial [Ruminiclostridium cellobioparum]|uniref:ATP-binding protein n=1 Tax=Ruminiclostridium cellobioparum TaxID=29355 RepID=UPI0028B17F16